MISNAYGYPGTLEYACSFHKYAQLYVIIDILMRRCYHGCSLSNGLRD